MFKQDPNTMFNMPWMSRNTKVFKKNYRPYRIGKGFRASSRSFTGHSHSGAQSNGNGFSGQERKFLDVQSTLQPLSLTWARVDPTSGSTDNLSTPAQGVGQSQHLGRTFYINAMFIHGQVFTPTVESLTIPNANFLYRICVVLDKQSNGAALTATDVMVAPVSTTADALSFRDLNNTHRFQILYDTGPVQFKVGPSQMADAGTGTGVLFSHGGIFQGFTMNKVWKKPIKVRVDGTTADISSVADFSIHMIAVSTSSALDIEYISRMRFTEA